DYYCSSYAGTNTYIF
nr:immunoglobulin light chain junction region [Macaca mulatta]MOW05356.1 immunoglobulin light chain junction region [Macaca mulatta]MOW06894.1 immunoglobulin light chain junction region [Macaca mulatta]MOW06957.1 immunoglobulin light chain junction region [Macaca mulatta]MOW07709.1 immunoglobulin light chain junction region [Macaca mulatta]